MRPSRPTMYLAARGYFSKPMPAKGEQDAHAHLQLRSDAGRLRKGRLASQRSDRRRQAPRLLEAVLAGVPRAGARPRDVDPAREGFAEPDPRQQLPLSVRV